jgi:thiosulfate/3-mercaptopyruvate sulfurtransferase
MALSVRSFAFPGSTSHDGVKAFPLLSLSQHQRRCSASNGLQLRMAATSSEEFTGKNLWSVEECLTEYQSNKDNVQFLDATWFHKGQRNGKAEFLAGPRLPGAHYWDIVDLSCSYELFPEQNPKKLFAMFPPEKLVAAAFDWMKITPEKSLIVYAREGTRFTPRTWYMLKQYCAQNQVIGLMQGSIEEWIEKGGPIDKQRLEESTSNVCQAKNLVASNRDPKYPVSQNARDRLVDMDYILGFLEKDKSCRPTILDTRGSSFAKGHIPGAIHVPYSSLTDEDSTIRLKSKEELAKILQEKLGDNVYSNLSKVPALLTCGSAVSVCHLALAFKELGFPDPMIYDGSWNEWGKDTDTPKAV